jgi:ACS family hexuronate transporter-like MFS transporter
MGRYRWVVCFLLFLAATVNYIDRQVIGILKPTLQGEFGWSEIDYADIVFSFQLAYAVGLVVSGRVMDRLGVKTGFAIAIVVFPRKAVGSVVGFGGMAGAVGGMLIAKLTGIF